MPRVTCLECDWRFGGQDVGEQIREALSQSGGGTNGRFVLLLSDCINPIYGADNAKSLAATVFSLCQLGRSFRDKVKVLVAQGRRGGNGSVREFFEHLTCSTVEHSVALVHTEVAVSFARGGEPPESGEENLESGDVVDIWEIVL